MGSYFLGGLSSVFEHIYEPGGFQWNYIKLHANEQGTKEPQMLNNFIDFLLLFGHFICHNHCYICHLGLPTFQAWENLDKNEDKEKLENKKQLTSPSYEVTDTTENIPQKRGTVRGPLTHNSGVTLQLIKYYYIIFVSQTSFGHISTNSSTIPTVLKPA